MRLRLRWGEWARPAQPNVCRVRAFGRADGNNRAWSDSAGSAVGGARDRVLRVGGFVRHIIGRVLRG